MIRRHASTRLWSPRRATAIAGMVVTAVATAAACGADPVIDPADSASDAFVIGEDTTNPRESDAGIGDQCLANGDCRGGEVCRDGRCREFCDASTSCSQAFEVCNTAQRICVQCVAQSDCRDDETCGADNTCSFFCRSDSVCPEGLYCEFSTGTCFIPDCIENTDCQGGFLCEDLRCVEIEL